MIKINDKAFEFGDAVTVELYDGKAFGGVLSGFYPSSETYSGHDEIEIDEGGIFRTLEIEDISTVKAKS